MGADETERNEVRTMSKAQAIRILGNYAVNFAIRRASEEVRDAIKKQPYDKLGWWEMDRLYDKVVEQLRDENLSLYFYSNDDEFKVALWGMNEGTLTDMVRGQLRAITAQTLELLGESALKQHREDAKRENVDS